MIAEVRRLAEDATRDKNWKRWGPHLAERQWATVREEYSPWLGRVFPAAGTPNLLGPPLNP
jgi:hypothetical protein